MLIDKSPLMMARVRVKEPKKINLRLFVVFALYVPYQLLLSVDAFMNLLWGRPKQYMKASLDTLSAVLSAIMSLDPQTYVDVDVRDGKEMAKVKLKTIGFKRSA